MSVAHSIAILIALLSIIAAAPFEEEEVTPTPNYRLPSEIRPSAYEIILRPYLLESDAKRFTFDGEIFINVTSIGAINKLVLHSKNLNYTLSEYYYAAAASTAATRTPLTNVAVDDVTDKRTYTLPSNLEVGTIYTLHFKYVGTMDDDMFGFYRSSYTDQQNVTKWLASTMFESVHARRAFPGFDEPNFKATFGLTIIRHKSMNSYANTRISSKTRDGDYYIDVYERTPLMSTYLVAFLVSDFNERTDGTFGVLARPEYYDQTEYGFHIGQVLLNEFDKYLNLPYYEQGIDKLDMAAIPDFEVGAMENWGLMTYRERTLLYDAMSSSLSYKQTIAKTIAHEEAHLWFGDFVTCEWWSYTWLHEGFARYFEYHMTARVETHYRLDQQFVVDELQFVMGMDSTNSTNPMTDEDTNSPSEINRMFNFISYTKGATIVRMFKYAMGEVQFQTAIQEYLATFKHRNAVPDDLLMILLKHWPESDRRYAVMVFKTFTEQVGYPVVTVQVSNDRMSMTIKQNRFLLTSNDGSNELLLYTVPFTYTTNVENDFNATTPKLYHDATTIAKTVSFEKKIDWVIGNIQETGYYRVNYDQNNWHQIHQALLSPNWSGIHELNRAQIVDDLFQLARADVVAYELALNIIEYMDTEVHYLPWTAAFNGYNYLTIRLGTDTTNFGVHIRKQLEKVFNELGFDEKSTDSPLEIFNRAKVLAWSCKYGNGKCISQAKSLFSGMQSNPIPVNIRTAVYCTAMREGTVSDYDTLFRKYKTETAATEQVLILNSLGCVKMEQLIKKHFNNIISNQVRRQDKTAALTTLYSENNENVTPVFDLVTEQFEELAQSLGSYSAVAGVISNIASRFTEESQAKKLQAFNADHKDKFGTSAAILLAAEKTVAENLEWSAQRLSTFKQYLEKRSTSSASSINAMTAFSISLLMIFSKILS